MNDNIYKLKYYPFPREKDKREYVIGEAFLRYKKIPEDELATLQNVTNDPPDLVVNTKDYGLLSIEVTEAVPHNREAIVQAKWFLKRLREHLNGLETIPRKPLRVCLHRDEFDMPKINETEIDNIARWINSVCEKSAYQEVDTKVKKITLPNGLKISLFLDKPLDEYTTGNPPICISVIPARDTLLSSRFQNNLYLQDSTGFPIDHEEIKKCVDKRIENKGRSDYPKDIDILIIWAELGMLGFQEISEEIKSNLLCNLSFSGIYILQITMGKNEYIVNVTPVREHPIFPG